jgi:hypothetical protein
MPDPNLINLILLNIRLIRLQGKGVVMVTKVEE